MKTNDARKLSREDLRTKREEVLRLHLENIPVMKIVENTGMSWPAVNKVIKQYTPDGNVLLMPEQRGRKQGMGRMLSIEQENEIRRILYRKRPYQINITSTQTSRLALWSRDSVTQLIQQKYKTDLSPASLSNYLKRWGFPPMKKNQKPIARCSKEIRGWLEKHYEHLMQGELSNNTTIFWMDRKMVSIGVFSEKSGKPVKQKMISAISNQGKEFWLIINGTFDSGKQIRFIKNLINVSRGQRVLMIRSSATYFTTNEVANWIGENVKQVELFPPILPKEQELIDKKNEARWKKNKESPPHSSFHSHLDECSLFQENGEPRIGDEW